MALKAFVIGLPKCGTTTIHRAFTASGLRSAHWAVDTIAVGKILSRNYNAGRDPMTLWPEMDAVTQADFIDHTESHWPSAPGSGSQRPPKK